MDEGEEAFILGKKYFYGIGVPQNYAEAAKWFRKSEEGFFNGRPRPKAQAKLGFMYENGYGVPKDYTEAAKWYRKAAEQGDANGQNNLGVMYENGRGVPRDRVLALALYTLSAKNDASPENNAPRNRDSLAKVMRKSKIEEAQWLAQELGKPGKFARAIVEEYLRQAIR